MSSQNVPFFACEREYAAHRDEIMTRVESALSTGRFLQGDDVGQFEQRVAQQCDRRFGVAVNSCTDALYFALLSAGVGEGDEVLVTDFSFIASASCIVRTGAKPVFVDVDDFYNMDLASAEEKVTSRTKAMIFVHLFGLMGDPEKVEDFAESQNILLIEDAAQAIGARYGGRPAGSMGLSSCISFDPTKVLSAPGSGGIFLTDDPEIDGRVRRLRYHGKDQDGRFVELGFNSQMPTLTAALLNLKLDYREPWQQRRREIADQYREGLSEKQLSLPREPDAALHIYHKFVLRSSRRDAIRNALVEQGIGNMIHYAMPLHKQEMFATSEYTDAAFPHVMEYCQSVISLPIHPFLTDDEVGRVVEMVRSSA